ncbi:hypothetical protein ACQJBY_046933 [Aegilops geniculata]
MIIVLAGLAFAYFALVKLFFLLAAKKKLFFSTFDAKKSFFFYLGMHANTQRCQGGKEKHSHRSPEVLMDGCGWNTGPPNRSYHHLPPLHHSKPHPLHPPLRQPPSLPRPAGHGSSGRRLAGRGAAAAPPTMPRRRFIVPGEGEPAAHLLEQHHRAAPATEAAATPAVIVGGGDGDDVAAVDPVHPGHGRADDPGRAADQVPGRQQRGGHLHLRAAVGVRLVGGAGRHHGVLHDRRGGHAELRGRQRQVRQRQAGGGGGQVRDAHPEGLGPLHALHGALLPGQRPPVPQEVAAISVQSNPPSSSMTMIIFDSSLVLIFVSWIPDRN